MRFSEMAAEVIRLADARLAYWDTELPKVYPDYPIIRPNDPPTPVPPEDGMLRQFLPDLDPDVIYKLFLTMNLGRDYFAPIQLEERYAETKANFPDVKVAVALLAGKVMLGKYLRNGLALLSQVGVDLDQASLEPAGNPQ